MNFLRLSIQALGKSSGAGGPSVIIAGLVAGIAVPGDHATITASMSDGSAILTRAWGSTAGGSDLGTGVNPTDYSAFDRLYLTVTTADGTFSTSAAITVDVLLADNTSDLFRTSDGFNLKVVA